MARGFTVALVGADGAGKTTVGRRLERELPVPAKYIYMGVSAEASNYLLPTTRLVRALKRARGVPPDTSGPPPAVRAEPVQRSGRGRAWAAVKDSLRLANLLGEEWQRQLRAWLHVRGGGVVVFDRHFYADFYAYDIVAEGRRSLPSRVHGFTLSRLPKPDLVLFLDASPEILFARKQEGSVEALRRRREQYLKLAGAGGGVTIVDASQSPDAVMQEVLELIETYARTRRAPTPGPSTS